jgi:hypothetical protein
MLIFLILLLILSLACNAVLVWYSRIVLSRIYSAAEAASEIFTRLDAYKTHIKSINQLEMFYGDRNLKEITDHTKDLLSFLKKYEMVYSFTQPELEEILKEEDLLEDDEYETEVAKKI